MSESGATHHKTHYKGDHRQGFQERPYGPNTMGQYHHPVFISYDEGTDITTVEWAIVEEGR